MILKKIIFILPLTYILNSSVLNGQFYSCYYFKSEVATFYYHGGEYDTAYHKFNKLLLSNRILTRSDFFKLALIKKSLKIKGYKIDLENYLRSGGELKYILQNDSFKNDENINNDLIDYKVIVDSIQNTDSSNIKLIKFIELLDASITISNYVRNNNKIELYSIVDSLSFVILSDFLMDKDFMNKLKPTPSIINKSNELMAFLIHANYYSKPMSDSIAIICNELLEKNIIRPKDYWYIHYRRLEVLDKGKSRTFEKGTKEEIENFRIKIGMLLDEPILINTKIEGNLNCKY